jgi:hypothetical protein
MNRIFLFALTIALSAGAATSVFTASEDHRLAGASTQQNSAAFRDGMYLAKLDAETGRRPHLTASRWTSASDRSAYLAGYESVYGRVGNAYAAEAKTSSNSELIGFHDGVSDGTQHRQSSRRFQVDKTENYRHADRGENYRQAYVNGYQQAFYGEQNPMFRELSQQASF